MADGKILRCAIYTRKSTEFGLEQDFNSLDAQREACEAYIKSQAHEGWKPLPARYDDGGISGASLERPALQSLLEEIKSRRIDAVVVYKVDRLTRALADFAKLVELFDAHGVSFVSVTQQFNTTTSMGRLTLNVLLSFAQFEREVTAERIRDKIAASKKKGIWMGGNPPFGYIAKDRKLVIDEAEAETLRYIFRRYLEVSGIRELKDDLDARGIVTKVRKRADGRTSGGIPFYLGPLASLLKNRVYVGEVFHRGTTYPGQHVGILDWDLFERVQQKLADHAVERRNKRVSSNSILMGKIFDDAGNRMSPSSAQKGGARYRFYTSAPWKGRKNTQRASRRYVMAAKVEEPVLKAVWDYADKQQASKPKAVASDAPNDHQLIEWYVYRVVLLKNAVSIEFKSDRSTYGSDADQGGERPNVLVPIFGQTRRPRREIIRSRQITTDVDVGLRSESHRTLLEGIAKARKWADELLYGHVADTTELARREKCSERHIRMILPLAFLSPDIVTAALANKLPPHLTMTRLLENLPPTWQRQRIALGLV